QMVAAHVAATVADFSPSGEQNMVPILSKAKIPQIGTTAFSVAEQDPYNFLLMSQTAANAGTATLAKSMGKNVVLVSLDIPISEAYAKFFATAAKVNHQNLVRTVKVPLTAADVSSQAAQAIAGNPDGIILLTNAQIAEGVMKAAKQLGYKGKFVSVTN